VGPAALPGWRQHNPLASLEVNPLGRGMSTKHRSVVHRHHRKAWVEMLRARQAEEEKVSAGESGMEDSQETQTGGGAPPLLEEVGVAAQGVRGASPHTEARMAKTRNRPGVGHPRSLHRAVQAGRRRGPQSPGTVGDQRRLRLRDSLNAHGRCGSRRRKACGTSPRSQERGRGTVV